MSGTAAISAAIRRRAGGSNGMKQNSPPPYQQHQQNVQRNIQATPPSPPTDNLLRPMSPAELLLNHNKMIIELQKEIDSLKQAKPETKSATNDPSQLEYFKNQYAVLNEDMKEMKKLLIKVQTFSMETNLELLKMKRLLKQDIPETEEIREEFKNILSDNV